MKKKRKYLSNEEKEEILRLHYLEGVIQAELARRFGFSEMTISRLIRIFAASNRKLWLCFQSRQETVVPWTAYNENQSYFINPSTWNSRKTKN